MCKELLEFFLLAFIFELNEITTPLIIFDFSSLTINFIILIIVILIKMVDSFNYFANFKINYFI